MFDRAYKGATFSIRGQLHCGRGGEKLMRMQEYIRNLKIPAHGWGNRRTLSGLQDVKPRKQRICNPRFEREIVREFF